VDRAANRPVLPMADRACELALVKAKSHRRFGAANSRPDARLVARSLALLAAPLGQALRRWAGLLTGVSLLQIRART